MKRIFLISLLLVSIMVLSLPVVQAAHKLYFVGDKSADLLCLIKDKDIEVVILQTLDYESIRSMPKNSSVIITAPNYPKEKVNITSLVYRAINSKSSIRVYIEYPNVFPDRIGELGAEIYNGKLERGVVTSDFFGNQLPKNSLLGINDCYIIPVSHNNPDVVYAKVAGFDKAEFGLEDTDNYPLLFRDKNVMISTTALSNFVKGRYAPNNNWRIVWSSILNWLLRENDFTINSWDIDPHPTLLESSNIDDDIRLNSIKSGTEWYFNSGLLLHPSWKEEWLKFQGDGKNPVGPPIGKDKIVGDGSMGILEGHASTINYDGTQEYRYWIRNDVQGEVAYAMAAAGRIIDNDKYRDTSERLMDFLFYNSNARELTSNVEDGSYGLLGWSYTHPFVIYADDNARLLLGAIGASSYLDKTRWNKFIVEGILANYRTTSKYGFQGRWLNTNSISDKGWKHFYNSEDIRLQPHFESWIWACYIWLYDKTGYKPLLDKAKIGIKMVMEGYPDKWRWTNGMQQERARMILPLAWLLKVENTDEHKGWLNTIVDDLIEYQQDNGALIEAIGENVSLASYGPEKSNADYGTTEAPLIFNNGDKVADMLYTSNFAIFSLNEAAKITGNVKYENSVHRLSDFLTRIQINSEKHPDLDGGWFRAFDFGRWDYWASNSDVGWGAWCTLSGWTQSWIVATKVLIEDDTSFWEQTKDYDIKYDFSKALWMLEE